VSEGKIIAKQELRVSPDYRVISVDEFRAVVGTEGIVRIAFYTDHILPKPTGEMLPDKRIRELQVEVRMSIPNYVKLMREIMTTLIASKKEAKGMVEWWSKLGGELEQMLEWLRRRSGRK